MKQALFCLMILPAWGATEGLTVPFPGEQPGTAGIRIEGNIPVLANQVLEAVPGKGLSLVNKALPQEQGTTPSAQLFSLQTAEGSWSSCDFSHTEFAVEDLQADLQTARYAARHPGKAISAVYTHPEAGVEITWRAELRDGAPYVRQHFSIRALRDVTLTGFSPIQLKGTGFTIPGETPGTPLVHESHRSFFAVELPVAMAQVREDGASICFDCKLPMKAGQEYVFTAASGVYPTGQMRRGFLAYLEQERATPYRQFLHYNCWYDHGLNPTEENMLATVEAYGRELVSKRGIKLDSFVLDDGWDDFHTDLWQPHPVKFPHGFSKLSEAIRGIDSHFGIWISPLGGYSGNEERTAHARRMGLIPENQQTLDLSCPEYYHWYLSRCRELMEKDGVNFFKWDRAGGGVSPHFMSLLHIANELRVINPQLFLSTTVGTWPSPFWLNFVDCIWRTGSSDVNWAGEGSNREQYITYRDSACYRLIVRKAPLFPLNSLMHHGIVLGKEFQGRRTSDARAYKEGKALEPQAGDGDFMHDTSAHAVDFPVNNDLKSDIRILLGSGTNLQELYLTPAMMNDRAWDDVAEAVRWARRYADVLADTHWVGGDPEKGEVYGYAAWRGDKGATLVLRNPSSQPRRLKLETALFEPTQVGDTFSMASPYPDQRLQRWTLDTRSGSLSVEGQEGTLPTAEDGTIELQPFEVLVFSVRFDKAEQ